MLYPDKREVEELLGEYDVVPVFYEILSDSCTPVNIFNALKQGEETCFILESVDNSEQWGRYSFIGVHPKMELKIKNGKAVTIEDGHVAVRLVDDPAAYLAEIMSKYKSPSFPNRPKMTGGLVGYFGYDMVRYMEKTLTNPPQDDLDMPDCHLMLYDEIVAFDHLTNKAVIILNIYADGDLDGQYGQCAQRAREIAKKLNAPAPAGQGGHGGEIAVSSNMTREQYARNVEKAKEYIRNGDIFQVVLSQRFEIDNPPDPFDVYRVLRASNPSPYLFYFKLRDYSIAGASPEMLVNVTGGIVTTKPLAGTIRRGKTEEEDAELKQILLSDPKERAEHTMLVDLGRNDVGRVSKFGTVEVTKFMEVEKYSTVMHLMSDVKGILRDGLSAVDALMSVLPAGTLSGAPKVRAMEIIDELENERRGLYGGTVGYLGFDGNIDTCIAIRTVLFRNGKAYVQAGAGIVADSDPEKEFAETENKALAAVKAVKEAAAL